MCGHRPTSSILTLHPTPSPPAVNPFWQTYGGSTQQVQTGDLSPSADDLFKVLRAGRDDGAAGLDAWKPGELKWLPRQAWVQRERVLDLARQLQRWPTA